MQPGAKCQEPGEGGFFGSIHGRDETLDAALDSVEMGGIPEDDEDRVVAGDGAEDFRPFFPVDGLGHGLRAARKSFHQQQVAGALGADEEAVQQALERRRLAPVVRRERVIRPSVGIGRLDQAELADVAGDGGLGDVEPALDQELAEHLLAGDAGFGQDVQDCGMAITLAHGNENGPCRPAASRVGARSAARAAGEPGVPRRAAVVSPGAPDVPARLAESRQVPGWSWTPVWSWSFPADGTVSGEALPGAHRPGSARASWKMRAAQRGSMRRASM